MDIISVFETEGAGSIPAGPATIHIITTSMKNIAIVTSSLSKNYEKIIYWYVGNKCNYRCSYCHPNYYNGSHNWHSHDVVVPFLNQFQNSFVLFSGGEPTFHPQLFDIFRDINPTIKVGVVSNGSKPLEYWNQLLGTREQIDIVFSYHYETINEDAFFTTALSLAKNSRCSFMVTFLMPTNNYWDQGVAFYKRLTHAGIDVQPKLRFVSSPFVAGRTQEGLAIDPNYTADQVAWVQEHAKNVSGSITLFDDKFRPLEKNVDTQYLISHGIDNFVGWRCSAPKKNLLIAPDGTVTTGLCAQRKILGNIFDHVDLGEQPYDVCQTTHCTGWIDAIATKTKLV